MLVQKHREYEKSSKEGCFSVGQSLKEIYSDLNRYCELHSNKSVWYYIHKVRPSKINLRPEYMMEIELITKENSGYIMIGYEKAQ